jgi:hypothetical protein
VRSVLLIALLGAPFAAWVRYVKVMCMFVWCAVRAEANDLHAPPGALTALAAGSKTLHARLVVLANGRGDEAAACSDDLGGTVLAPCSGVEGGDAEL